MSEQPDPDLTIHQRMVGILGDLPAIGKNRRNAQQNFMFRGIDDVLDALNPLLAKWGVYYVPRVLERVESRRETSRGGTLYVVNLHVEYTFFGAGGDSVVASCWGEGTDSGDKATNKAMTGAMKYTLFQAFAISTGEAQDSDANTDDESSPVLTPEQMMQQRKEAWGEKPLPEGWESFEHFDTAHQTFKTGMGTLSETVREKVKAEMAAKEIGWPMSTEQYDAACLIVAYEQEQAASATDFAEA